MHYDKVDIRALQLRSFICITNTWTHVHCVNICAFKYVRVNYVGICALRFCRCACITITWIYIRAFKLRGLVHYICVRAWLFYVVCMHFRCVCYYDYIMICVLGAVSHACILVIRSPWIYTCVLTFAVLTFPPCFKIS